MKKFFEKFSTDSALGKIFLFGFFAPIISGIIRFYISEKTNQSFNDMTGYMPWEAWLYFLSLIWFFIAFFRSSLSTRCPKCLSANNSKIGKEEIERYEEAATETIKVDTNVLTGAPKYESYDVPTTFIKIEFSFKCHNCQNAWKKVIDVEEG